MSEWYNFPGDVSNAPTDEGVYMLAAGRIIVYVGRADNLRERLSQHPDSNNPCLQRKNISYFAYEVTGDSQRREQELIDRHNPECNRT